MPFPSAAARRTAVGAGPPPDQGIVRPGEGRKPVLSTIRRLRIGDEATSVAVALRRRAWLRPVERVAAMANGLPVWLAASALLAMGRRSRRAAAEGAAALMCASAVSNLAAKPLVGRRRPIAIPRRTTPKRTLSFPSSHAATSFAYATAVTARWPAGGAPLLVVAGVIAGSRVHSRHHRISEVLAGALLGAAIGALVHRVSDRALGPMPSGRTKPVPT